MKIQLHSKSEGSIMLACIVVAAAVGVVLVGYLQFGQTSQSLAIRSQKWNLALPVAEAGMEEALTQLNYTKGGNLAANGWTANGSIIGKGGKTVINNAYVRTRVLSPDAYYEVGISMSGTKHRTNPVTISATGYVREALTTNYIARTITGTIGLTNQVFTKAIIAKKHVRMGKSSLVDSFDSLDNAYSTGGKYDAKKNKATAGVATVSDKKNAIQVDKTKIYGDAATSNDGKDKPGGIEFKGNGTLGDKTWVDTGNLGLQSGKLTHDFQYDFAPVEPPWTGGAIPPAGGKVGKTDYQYILGTGNYQLGKVDLKKPMIVTGNAVLYVTGDFKIEEDIVIQNNASLTLYMGGKNFEVKDKNVLMNNGDATQFRYYGLNLSSSLPFKKP